MEKDLDEEVQEDESRQEQMSSHVVVAAAAAALERDCNPWFAMCKRGCYADDVDARLEDEVAKHRRDGDLKQHSREYLEDLHGDTSAVREEVVVDDAKEEGDNDGREKPPMHGEQRRHDARNPAHSLSLHNEREDS